MQHNSTRTLLSMILVVLAVSACTQAPGQGIQPTPTPILLPESTSTAIVTSALPTVQVEAKTTEPDPTPLASGTLPRATLVPAETSSVTRLLVLGNAPAITLREHAVGNSRAVAYLQGSESMWAEAQDPSSAWVLVTYGDEGASGWVALSSVQVFGDVTSLPVSDESARMPSAATPTGSETGATQLGQVLSEPLNVRQEPGLDRPVIGTLSIGETVSVVGRTTDGEWLAIQWKSGSGWVAARFISLEGSESDLPALATASTGDQTPAEPLSGTIVIASRIDGEIIALNADGSNLRRVADGMDPALSPDGSRVAFARWSGEQGIYVVDLHTGQESLLTGPSHPRHPTWSGDGQRLAFSYTSGSSTCLGTPMGCVSESVIRGYLGGQDCVDTPSGRLCISDFPVHSIEKTGLAQVTLADTSWLDLPSEPPDAKTPTWRPGSDEILYQGKQGFQITTPGGTTRALNSNADASSPAWSPDGQLVAVQIYLHDHADIFLLDASGQTVRRLTEPTDEFAKAANNVAPAWSPDGSQLLFLSDRDGAWRAYRMNADGTNQQLLLPDVLGQIALHYEFASENVLSWSH